jgi:nitrous oxide reductase accessory protein NosL
MITAFLSAALTCGVFATAADEPRPPGGDDRCAVCGMFVHKYPNWVATIAFAGGDQVFFDGPKDLFRYLFDLEKYEAQDREIAGVFVTEYYRVQSIDAQTAVFVTGSDVMGPMGGELVPFATRDEAEAFALDHGGKEILEFAEVTPDKVPR